MQRLQEQKGGKQIKEVTALWNNKKENNLNNCLLAGVLTRVLVI